MAKGAEPSPYPSAPDSLKPQCSDLQSKADITEKKVIIHLCKIVTVKTELLVSRDQEDTIKQYETSL